MHGAAPAQPSELKSNAIGARAARHLDLVFRTLAEGPGVTKNENFLRMMTGHRQPMGNVAIVSQADTMDLLEAAMRPLVESRLPSSVICVDGIDRDLAAHLVATGFAEESMPAMVVDIERMAATTLPPGYAFERVSAANEKGWTEAFATGYPVPFELARVFAPEAVNADMAASASVQYFAITKDGRAVATSMLYFADGLAGIYCVATVPGERGKGLGAHVTAEPLRRARQLGYRVGILQSSSAGHPIYLRLGFEDRATVPIFVRMP